MSNDDLLKKAVCEEYKREIEALPSAEELEEMILVSPEFHNKMAKLFKKHKRRIWLFRIGKNIAFFLILAASSFLLLCILNEDIRATCLQWVRTMASDGMMDYSTVPSDKENNLTAGFTLEYIPEGYVLKSTDMKDMSGNISYCYGNNELDFYYMMENSTIATIDNENSIASHVELDDGTVCDFYKSNSSKTKSKLVWRKGEYICTLLISQINENELVPIANGVKIAFP